VELGARFLRIMCISTPFMAVSYILTGLFQATGRTGSSLTMTMFRKGIVELPLFYLMDLLLPMYGLIWTQPVVDILAVALALVLLRRLLRSLKKESAS